MSYNISKCESCHAEMPFLMKVMVTHDVKTITKESPAGDAPYVETWWDVLMHHKTVYSLYYQAFLRRLSNKHTF
jgi:hypothetical protein